MCGRFYVDDGTAMEIAQMVQSTGQRLEGLHTGEVCPSQPAGVLVRDSIGGKRPGKGIGDSNPLRFRLEEMKWGFPQYQRKGLLINARAETALERKAFRESVLHRRCIIPAKQFYEWDSDKNKVTFFREGLPIVYMAGCYHKFQDGFRFIVLTTEANKSVRPVHSRMPLVLEKDELEDWVYEDSYTGYALGKVPPMLGREQEYEQQSLCFI